MRRDVKRSLIIWPAAASVTITAVSWLTCGGFDFQQAAQRFVEFAPGLADWASDEWSDIPYSNERAPLAAPSSSTVAETLALGIEAPSVVAEVEARSEHGARALQLPQRVAKVFGVDSRSVAAPVVDEQQELAGMVDSETVQGGVPPSAASQAGRTRSGISRSEPWFPANIAGDQPLWDPPSVLPKSTRYLGRRVLHAPANGDRDSDGAQDQTELSLQSPSDSPSTDVPGGDFSDGDPLRSDVADKPPGSDNRSSSNKLSEPVPEVKPAVEPAVVATPPALDRGLAGWPVTSRLDQQLRDLITESVEQRDAAPDAMAPAVPPTVEMSRWSNQVMSNLDQLRTLPRLGDPRAEALIKTLTQLAQQGLIRAEQVSDREHQVDWLMVSHALARRLAVWRPVWQVTSGGSQDWMVSDQDAPAEPSNESFAPTATSLREVIANVRQDLAATEDEAGWREFLLLEEIERVARGGNSRERTQVAQRVLSRLAWHGLNEEQQRWLDRDSVQQLAGVIKPWASGAVDYANLLRQIERQESESIDLAAIDIAGAAQSLRFSENRAAAKVGDAINTYYRNANLRLALSQQMLQRMLPTIEPQSIPVRTRILGSRVRGMSRIESDLQLKLHPSPNKWTFDLQVLGQVRTNSTGTSGPVAVRTSGKADFAAATPIEIDARGIDLGDAEVDVDGRSRLRGVRSDYDGWPLVGSLVRSIARSRYDEMQPRSNWIANRRIQTEVQREFDERIGERVETATEKLGQMVLGPLARLQLDPKVTDMQTTDTRLLARYRLAGDWQLGAFTPRPRAPRSSLMSVQVHQSALNNMFEQLIPREQPLTIHELVRSSMHTFGQEEIELPDDIPKDVSVQFSKTRPITVEIEDGRLWVTLRVIRLRRGDRLDLTRFIVRAQYKPEMNGTEANLVREGHLRISGPGMSMRERLPIRAIFNKVLSPNRPFPLVLPTVADHQALEGLAVSQLELREGWIAMAISEEAAPRIALIKP